MAGGVLIAIASPLYLHLIFRDALFESCMCVFSLLIHGAVEASRRGEKYLDYSRDADEGTYGRGWEGGGGEKSLFSDPGSESRLGEKGSKEKCETSRRWDD